MALLHMPDLSPIDFVGLEQDDDFDPKDLISAIALVCKVALAKIIALEKALINSREEPKPAAVKEDGKKIQGKRATKPPSRFWEACTKAKRVNKFTTDDEERPISVWRVKKSSKRSAMEDYEKGDGTSSGCGSLALQVTKMEDQAESHKRRRSQEQCYSPEPISVWPPTRKRVTKRSKHAVEDYEKGGGLLALQVDDEFETESHERKRTRSGEKKKKRKKKNVEENRLKKPRPPKPPANTGPEPPPGLPESFRERMEQTGGMNPLLVIQKRLFHSDISKGHNRLSIPVSCVRNHQFLTEYETAWLHSRDGQGHPNPIDVKIMDAEQVWDIKLKWWEMPKSSSYVLSESWHQIVDENNLIVGDLVQIWAFRVHEELAFAIVKVDENAEQQALAIGCSLDSSSL